MGNFHINNYKDFENIVSKIQFGRIPFIGEQYQELYRGQSKNTYNLKSGISRYVNSIYEIKELEENLIQDFKAMVNNVSNYRKIIHLSNNNVDYENDWRWLEQMQHYRIPTRLLDWSLDPKIALFFAVESNENDIGQFWIYKTPLNWSCDDHFNINSKQDDLNIISNSSFYVENEYKDKIAEQRRAFQAGKFSIQDYSKSLIAMEEQPEIKDIILKYTINPKSKKLLLDDLSKLNITKNSVYVEFDDEIENLITELKIKYNLK
ncbi:MULTISPECIES: FRG domain-containing protein [unclassified Empedobacter]|uniref:FRG domain-containing protein n=1 Tax=unclassified Empedobacter TaxID=2643773 RepID=UPI0025BA633A|nr:MULTISPECIES: FRG domain-containing protein [unclassified Empedobacter]